MRSMPHLSLFRLSLVLGLVLVFAAACGPSSLAPVTFDAVYAPMGSIGDFDPADDCATFGDLVVEDGRDGEVVGRRYMEEGGERYDVSMGGDVEGWLQDAVEHALDQAGIEHSDASDRTIRVTLERVETDEAVYRRAEYDAKVVIEAAVSGGESWSDKKDGFSENYGYQGSAENYQETVNHAMDRALADLVNDAGFTAALCG